MHIANLSYVSFGSFVVFFRAWPYPFTCRIFFAAFLGDVWHRTSKNPSWFLLLLWFPINKKMLFRMLFTHRNSYIQVFFLQFVIIFLAYSSLSNHLLLYKQNVNYNLKFAVVLMSLIGIPFLHPNISRYLGSNGPWRFHKRFRIHETRIGYNISLRRNAPHNAALHCTALQFPAISCTAKWIPIWLSAPPPRWSIINLVSQMDSINLSHTQSTRVQLIDCSPCSSLSTVQYTWYSAFPAVHFVQFLHSLQSPTVNCTL